MIELEPPMPTAEELEAYAKRERGILIDEVSDKALEAAAFVAVGGFPTLPHTYCFACPSEAM